MGAVGFGLIAVGAMLIYAGMTGESLPAAVASAVKGSGQRTTVNASPARSGGGGRALVL